jgi:hypothetical protein
MVGISHYDIYYTLRNYLLIYVALRLEEFPLRPPLDYTPSAYVEIEKVERRL